MVDKISDTELYKQLFALETETDHLQTSNISQHLQHVTENLLSEIGATMPDYTLHNLRHVLNVLDIISKIIPVKVRLNRAELVLMIYAVALHDIGMLANRDEIVELKKSLDFKKLLAEYDKDADENEILSEYIRRNHVSRSCHYIDIFKSNQSLYKLDFEINGVDFSHYLKKIILSHELDISEMDEERYPVDALICHERVNVLFLALLLRLGDLLDFDKTRVPLCLLEHKKIKNEISLSEWEKHLSVEGVCITPETLEFEATCHSAEIHRHVLDFLKYIEIERKDTMECISKMKCADRFLTLVSPVKYRVKSDGSYIYEDLEISFDYKKVLSILMGTELYSSPDIFLRELLQNSYDACYTRAAFESRLENDAYFPKVKIIYDSETHILSIEDNGIGMDMNTVRNYILKIGKSYYKSKEFQSELLNYSPVSNFGIGILSCFMVSDSIQIESLRFSSAIDVRQPIDIKLNLNSSFVECIPANRNTTGTKISLAIHEKFWDKLSIDTIANIIKDNTAHQRIPITIICDGEELLLADKEINCPDYSKFTGIQVIKVNNDLLEGYLILCGSGQQSIVKQNKVSQQGFRINKKLSRSFVPAYVSYLGYDINIKSRLLSTKASREDIIDDNGFTRFRIAISEIILNFFKANNKILFWYMPFGTGNILSDNERELKFLKDNIFFCGLKSGQNGVFEPINFSDFEKSGKSFKIAFVFEKILNCILNTHGENYIANLFNEYEYIIKCSNNFYYFVQLARPYCVEISERITLIPGVAFFAVKCDFTRNISANDYKTDFSFTKLNEITEIVCDRIILCYISNNQNNFLRVIYNRHHPLGRLLIEEADDIGVKAFSLDLSSSIIYAVLDAKMPLDQLLHFNIDYIKIMPNTFDYSMQSKHIFKESILSSINTTLHKTIDNTLLEKYGIADLSLNRNDFIDWWFV